MSKKKRKLQERNRKNQARRQKAKSEEEKIKDYEKDCKRKQDLQRKLREAKQIRGSKEPENDTDEQQTECEMTDFLWSALARKRHAKVIHDDDNLPGKQNEV